MALGLEPNVRHRSPHPEMVRSLVANGFGYALHNARSLADQSLDGRQIVTVPLAGAHRPMRLGVATLSGSRPTRLVAEFRIHCAATITRDNIPGMRVR